MADRSFRVLNAEPEGYSPKARSRWREAGFDYDARALSPEELPAATEGIDVLIVRLGHRLDADFFRANRHLRAVVSATTGLDHIDLEAAAAAGVRVISLRGEVEFLRTVTATAEHAWGLLLALVRRLPEAAASAARGEWDRDRFRGHELRGRRLGILGFGRLGEMVARYGLAFGMEVAAYDPPRRMRGGGWVDGVGETVTLAELLGRSDVLSIHLPLDEETEGFVGAPQIAGLPRGAVIVNTSRGRILDGAAVVAAIESGRLAGAAVDVVAGETGPGGVADDPLVRFAARDPRVIVTPHIGGATLESMHGTEIFMAEKTIRELTAEPSPADPA